jgi:hypothetical protein
MYAYRTILYTRINHKKHLVENISIVTMGEVWHHRFVFMGAKSRNAAAMILLCLFPRIATALPDILMGEK